ncbi:hypothetical protein Tco_0511933 [Tanacetum coccineum]
MRHCIHPGLVSLRYLDVGIRYLSIVFSGRLLLFAMRTPRRFTIERLLTFLLGPMGCMCAIGEMYHEDLFRLPVIEEEGSQVQGLVVNNKKK